MRFVRFSILTFLPLLAAAAIWQALTWQDAPHKVALAVAVLFYGAAAPAVTHLVDRFPLGRQGVR